MTNEDPNRVESTPETDPFSEQVSPLLANLLYPSESDEPLAPITCYLDQQEPLTDSQIKDWLMLPPSVYVEEVPEADFWEPVTEEQDWHSEEEQARTAAFRALKQLIECELTGRQVFRVGETEIDVYLLGQQPNGTRAGIKTKVVQT